MDDRIELPLRFDAAAMQRDLLLLESSSWTDHYVPQHYQGTWSVLPLRAPADARHPIQMIYADPVCDAFEDTPLLTRCAYFPQVLAAFACRLQSVRLMKLTPGSSIKPHCDHDLAAELGRVRLHIPVTTNPDVDFRLNEERVIMQEGECWYLRLSDLHSVVNRGTRDRVHLVLDAVLNPWLQAQLTDGARAAGRRERVHAATAVLTGARQADPESSGTPDLERFRDAVRRDASLQQRFKDIDDRDAFVAIVMKVAAELGWRTTPDEIEQAMREARRRLRAERA